MSTILLSSYVHMCTIFSAMHAILPLQYIAILQDLDIMSLKFVIK